MEKRASEFLLADFSKQAKAAVEWRKTLISPHIGRYTPIPEEVKLTGLFYRSIAATEDMTRACTKCGSSGGGNVVVPIRFKGTNCLALPPCCDSCMRKRDMDLDRKMAMERQRAVESHRRQREYESKSRTRRAKKRECEDI